MWCCDTDYAIMPPVLWSNVNMPWELHMEEYPKLWQNEIYTTWKVGCPGEEVGLAMTFVSTSHREFDSHQLTFDIADAATIWYPVSRVDDVDDGDESTGEVAEDDSDEDDSDDEDVDEDLHKTATEIATKMDDSGFHSDAEDNDWVEAILGPRTSWMGKAPSYSLKALTVGSQGGMHTVSSSEEATKSSFDTFLREHAKGSGIGELIGGQALLRDYTTMAELKQLHILANEQVSITCRFDTKFSNTAFALLRKIHETFLGTGGIAQKFVDDMVMIALNFIRDTTAYESELLASDGLAFAARLACIQGWIANLIKEASALELTYEGAQKKFAGILKWVEKEVKEYLDIQSMANCMAFLDESFDSLRKFSDAFNVLPFVLVVVGTAITHHSLLTSLWVNVSHFPLKIFLLPLTSDATAALGQMVLLSYVARQSVAVWEGQAQLKPIPRTGTREMGPTLESDHGSNAGLNPQKLKQDQAGLTPSKKDQLEATSSKTPTPSVPPRDPPLGDSPPPLPLPSPARTHNTPKGQDTHPSGSVASLLVQFQQSQQSQSRNASPKGTPARGTPVKDVAHEGHSQEGYSQEGYPKKGEQMPSKKILMPDKSAEPPLKKQRTGSPGSDRGSETDHSKTDKSKKKKKRKKKEPKSEPTMATDSETEETEEQQEKCQQARKWKAELQVLKDYRESHNIFLHNLPEWGSCSHMGYLKSKISEPGTGFFIKLIKTWWLELEKQSQGIGHSVMSARRKLQKLKQMCGVKLSSLNNVSAEYLVEMFKYPGTGNHIPTSTADGYDSMPMIG